MNEQSHVPVLEPGGESTLQKKQELQVYARRKNPQANKEIMNPTYSQEDEPMVDSHLPKESGTSSPILDLDMPKAIRKGVRSCTLTSYFSIHLLFKFISFILCFYLEIV